MRILSEALEGKTANFGGVWHGSAAAKQWHGRGQRLNDDLATLRCGLAGVLVKIIHVTLPTSFDALT
jgi:hypothetical protein